jgi:hypothetical protein
MAIPLLMIALLLLLFRALTPSSPVTMGLVVLLMQSTKCCSSALSGSWKRGVAVLSEFFFYGQFLGL